MQAATPAHTFPWSWYVEPAVPAAEQEGVFRRCWQYVARVDQVAEPGRCVATRAGDVPVVVVRGREGELRAFLNVCRHRGSLVCEGERRRETLQCPLPRMDVRPRRHAALGAPELERGQFHFLFPNTTINVMPGRPNLSIGPVIPQGTERTYRFLDYFVAPDASEEWIDDFLAFDDQVGAEDRALVERVQAGVRSGLLDGGRLLPESERLIAHFQGLLVDALGG
jgi:phenylpropionate dioxygenase-like ring-hydroxylating dioxygenase large terminal subunit